MGQGYGNFTLQKHEDRKILCESQMLELENATSVIWHSWANVFQFFLECADGTWTFRQGRNQKVWNS